MSAFKHALVYPHKVKVAQFVLVYCWEDFKGWFKVDNNVHSKHLEIHSIAYCKIGSIQFHHIRLTCCRF